MLISRTFRSQEGSEPRSLRTQFDSELKDTNMSRRFRSHEDLDVKEIQTIRRF
jgi:hypothetical protein